MLVLFLEEDLRELTIPLKHLEEDLFIIPHSRAYGKQGIKKINKEEKENINCTKFHL